MPKRSRGTAPAIIPILLLSVGPLLGSSSLGAQTQLGPQVRAFVAVDAPVVALVHAKVIDGTGAAPRTDQTVILRGGLIESLGPSETHPVPDGAEVLDLSGKTLLPGFVMLHEHLFYPAGAGNYNTLSFSFPRLYLAGGVTTMRTGGSMAPYVDINVKQAIDSGQALGPTMDVTGPYLNGPGLPIPGVKGLRGPDDARRMVDFWVGEGSTSFKAYMQISRAELSASAEAVHSHGMKLTGHLCSVTYREAADLGIDNLEHGFMAATDFVADKEPDRCPRGARNSLLEVDLEGEAFQSLIGHLVEQGVAITSTNTVFEASTPGRTPPPPGAYAAMTVESREAHLRARARMGSGDSSAQTRLFAKNLEMEKAFYDAGGLLVVGTDPTGNGGVVSGYSNQRALELLVEGGFTVPEAVRIATLNGAVYLGLDTSIGSIEAGKEADLIVVAGDVAADVAAITRMELVFKDGVGFDSAKLFASVKGTVGIR